MKRIDFIEQQTQWAHHRTYTLLDQVPGKMWYVIPDGVGTNLAWQVGHLIISSYYNSIRVIVGSLEVAKQVFPIKAYAINFGMGASSPINAKKTEPDYQILVQQLKAINKISLEVIRTIDETVLDQPLVPTPMEHPLAHTKYEALMWDFQHTAWHSGQISLIRRALDKPLNFSDLRNPESL